MKRLIFLLPFLLVALLPGQTPQDSPRLGSLVRGGNLYLSLQDAIAIALENNLDVELQRIGPGFAETDIKRTQAGALPRGVPFSVREGPKSAGSSGADFLAPLLGPAPETNLSMTMSWTNRSSLASVGFFSVRDAASTESASMRTAASRVLGRTPG